MAGELKGAATTGSDCIFIAFNAANQPWNDGTKAFEDWTDPDYGNYELAATELGTSGWFVGDSPSILAVYYQMRQVITTHPDGDPIVSTNILTLPLAQTGQSAGLPTQSSVQSVQTGVNSIASGASVVNANNASGGAIPTLAQIWQDATAGHFTTANSIGKSLFTGRAPGDTLGGLLCNNAAAQLSALVINGSTSLNTLAVGSTSTFTGAFVANNAGNDIEGISVAANGIASPQNFLNNLPPSLSAQ